MPVVNSNTDSRASNILQHNNTMHLLSATARATRIVTSQGCPNEPIVSDSIEATQHATRVRANGSPQPNSLAAAIQATRHAAAVDRAKGSPFVQYLTPRGCTGIPAIDSAMDDLRFSENALWIANAHKIFQNCTWKSSGQVNVETMQWNADAPDKPPGCNGDAIIGFLGCATTLGSSLTPDAGWQVRVSFLQLD